MQKSLLLFRLTILQFLFLPKIYLRSDYQINQNTHQLYSEKKNLEINLKKKQQKAKSLNEELKRLNQELENLLLLGKELEETYEITETNKNMTFSNIYIISKIERFFENRSAPTSNPYSEKIYCEYFFLLNIYYKNLEFFKNEKNKITKKIQKNEKNIINILKKIDLLDINLLKIKEIENNNLLIAQMIKIENQQYS